MTYYIDIQNACEDPLPIEENTLEAWAKSALEAHVLQAEVTLRLVNKEEISHLNQTYRSKQGATNVLAFPCKLPKGVKLEYPLLGDIVICPQVLQEESISYEKPLLLHWAHIVIHGVLHLLGYDHIHEKDEEKMQAMEIKLLAELGYDNPYTTEDKNLDQRR